LQKLVENIAKANDLRRIAKARLFDVSRLEEVDLRKAVIEKCRHYCDYDSIVSAIDDALLGKDRIIRTITPILFGEVLLQEHQYSLPQKDTEEKILDWEQAIVDETNESSGQLKARIIHNFDFFKFVVEAAWENNNEISQDERILIEKVRKKLSVSEREYRIVEAQLGNFPKQGNELHTRDEINEVRKYLQERGVLFTYRDSDGNDHDIVPEEMVESLRSVFAVELRQYGYQKLISYKAVRNKGYLESVLKKCDIALAKSASLSDLQGLCVEHVCAKIVIGGVSPRDGLDVSVIDKWCRELGLAVSGTKNELIARVVTHYDGLIESCQDSEDEREPWFAYYEEFASRNYTFLRSQGLIEKDQDIDKRFEYATDYLFERMLGHKPLNLPGSEQPDGALSFGDGLLMWDNKSKESRCSLKSHLAQFDRYFSKAEKKGVALLVIAPDFTEESSTEARLHEMQTGNKLALITAAQLKEVAKLWCASKDSGNPFPLKYLTATGRFDSAILSAVIPK